MPGIVIDTRKPRKEFRPVKINPKKVEELHNQGLSATDIAKHQNVAISTITRYLEQIKPKKQLIQQYVDNQANTLALSLLKKQAVEDLLIDHWLEYPDDLLKQDMRVQKEIIHTLQGGRAYDYNEYRLQTNQSTDNHTIISKFVQDYIKGNNGNDND